MTNLFIIGAVFFGVSLLIGAVAFTFRDRSETKFENRLDQFTHSGGAKGRDEGSASSVLSSPLDEGLNSFEGWLNRVTNLRLWMEQADVAFSPYFFSMIILGGGVVGAFFGLVAKPSIYSPLGFGLVGLFMPIMWLSLRRKMRLSKFAAQLSDALELIARALRAGHSLGSGLNLVADEMPIPISKEFQRVFEEQNLNVPIEDALRSLTQRVPNLDLKFFVTAVILQRQTGGDLAEILDKIGHLIRERYKLMGQVQALTGEGRLSGIVLLGLPPCLAAVVYYLNPEYLGPLFTDPLGQKMLGWALVFQVLGALWIRKIINIKV